MKTLAVDYPTLHRTVEQVQQFITRTSPHNTFDFKSSLEDDLSICGDDAYFLLDEFSTKFNVDFRELEFDRYFTPENPSGFHLLLAPVAMALMLSFWLCQLMLALITWPFSAYQAKRIAAFSLYEYFGLPLLNQPPKRLTSATWWLRQ